MALKLSPNHAGQGKVYFSYGGTTGQSPTITVLCDQAYVTPTINSSTLTYNGSQQNLVTSVGSGGVNSWWIGYKIGSQATADNQITWANNATVLKAVYGGTYYIYYKYTADNDHCGDKAYTYVGSKVINPAPNPVTLSPSSTSSSRINIYNNHNSCGVHVKTITVYNLKGTVSSITSSNTGVATVSSFNTSSNTFTVTYVANGTATITVNISGNSDYNGTTLYAYIQCKTDTEYSTEYKNEACTQTGYNITSYGTPSVSIGSGLTAAGGSATITCSVTNNVQWYQKWESGCVTSHSGTRTGNATWSIGAQQFFQQGSSSGTTINRFSQSSGGTLDHTSMGTNYGSDYVMITVTNTGDSSKYANIDVVPNGIYNGYSDSWNIPNVANYGYNTLSACGGTVNPSISTSQSGTRTWTSGSTESISNSSFTYSYSMTTGNGFSINTSTGVITVSARGKSTSSRTSNTATVTVTGAGSKSSTSTTTVTQSGNTYSDSWNKPSISYNYGNIGAGGGTSSPSVTASQTGVRTWGCEAGTDALSNSSFTYSYSMTTGNGFSINTSTGVITADNRGTTIGSARTSNTATVTVSGAGSQSNTATSTCTQNANTLTGITFTVNSSSISYQGSTTGTVTATYTSGSSKNVSNDANTSYDDSADPDKVSFTKNS